MGIIREAAYLVCDVTALASAGSDLWGQEGDSLFGGFGSVGLLALGHQAGRCVHQHRVTGRTACGVADFALGLF
ncbi:hypothetical protein, partial [Streptomyces ardesiacus]|uniref:hypothetical protein n=1 Tax=Streptomyces ardesiacus TaxID=285564 RepID=UPI00363F5C80